MYAPHQLLTTPRLLLERVAPEHAEEMAAILDDPRLDTYCAGRAPTATALRERYRRISVLRSDDGRAVWPTWIVRRRDRGEAVGSVQATVDGDQADVGWVIAVASQGQGYATEAAQALIDWLEDNGVTAIQASIRPDNRASAAVAAHVGLQPTDERVDGDRIWRKPPRDIS